MIFIRGPPSEVRALSPLSPNWSSLVERYRVIETVEVWHVSVECDADEAAAVAAAVPKMIAGMTKCYQPDVVHVHQALQAAAEARVSHSRVLTPSRS